MTEYMFVRGEGFYFLECKDDEDAFQQAARNAGTLAAFNVETWRKVWVLAPSATQAESSTPATSSSDSATPAPDAC